MSEEKDYKKKVTNRGYKVNLIPHRMYPSYLESIVKEIANEEGLTLMQVRSVLWSIFTTTKRAMTEWNDKVIGTIRWMYFGEFQPSGRKLRKLEKKLRRQKEKELKRKNDNTKE